MKSNVMLLKEFDSLYSMVFSATVRWNSEICNWHAWWKWDILCCRSSTRTGGIYAIM